MTLARAGACLSIFLAVVYPASTCVEAEVRPRPTTSISVSRGHFRVISFSSRRSRRGGFGWSLTKLKPPDLSRQLPRVMLPAPRTPLFALSIPLWMPLGVTAGTTVALLYRDRRRGRPGPEDCRECGYSLADLPAGTRCPECGAERA